MHCQPLRSRILVETVTVAVDDHLIVHLDMATLAHHHHSVRMLTKPEWHLCLVRLVGMVPEVDLVVAPLMHPRPSETETERRPRHSP